MERGHDDDLLLAGMAAGDRYAAELFVRRHAPAVIGVAFGVVGDHATAEDIAQEAFSKAWRAAATYDVRRGGVRAWLLTITRNTAIDQVRIRRSRPLDPAAVAALVAGELDPSSPDDGVLSDAEAAQVRWALARIPDDQRRAVVLAAVGGHTAVQVGEIERIPLGTAKTRIRAGLRRMRELLEVSDRRD